MAGSSSAAKGSGRRSAERHRNGGNRRLDRPDQGRRTWNPLQRTGNRVANGGNRGGYRSDGGLAKGIAVAEKANASRIRRARKFRRRALPLIGCRPFPAAFTGNVMHATGNGRLIPHFSRLPHGICRVSGRNKWNDRASCADDRESRAVDRATRASCVAMRPLTGNPGAGNGRGPLWRPPSHDYSKR